MSTFTVSFVLSGIYRLASYHNSYDGSRPRIEQAANYTYAERRYYSRIAPTHSDTTKYTDILAYMRIQDKYVAVGVVGVTGTLLDEYGHTIPILQLDEPSLLMYYNILPPSQINKCTYLLRKVDNTKSQKEYASPRPTAQVETSSCGVCLEHPRTVAFGCGHIVCQSCAPKLTVCPICRAAIAMRLNLFM